MKTNLTITVISILIFNAISLNSFCQTKAELKKQLGVYKAKNEQLEKQLQETNSDKETIKTKLDRISNIDVDDVITPEEQPKEISIGESGWRIELNGNKYKSDLIGQLGTIWMLDNNNQIQPQGAVSLSDYSIEPNLINPDKDILYKKFISKGTKLEGSGSATFASITADISNEQFSQFTINIEGTSLIKPKLIDLKKIALEAKDVFDFANNKGVFICTGMHIIRYHSRIYSKSEGSTKITSPVVSIGGNFYAESNEESSEYLVVRQLTQLNKQSTIDTLQLIQQVTILTTAKTSDADLQKMSKKISPEELLFYFLKRQPTSEEIINYQNNPNDFLSKIGKLDSLNINEKTLLEMNAKKLIKVPVEVKSVDK